MLIEVSSDGGMSEWQDITGPINSIFKKVPYHSWIWKELQDVQNYLFQGEERWYMKSKPSGSNDCNTSCIYYRYSLESPFAGTRRHEEWNPGLNLDLTLEK